MRNCPNADLPAIYVDAVACGCSAPARINCRTIPIEIYEVDCLRCPSAMRLACAKAAKGSVIWEMRYMPFRLAMCGSRFPCSGICRAVRYAPQAADIGACSTASPFWSGENLQTCRDRGLAQYADGAARYFYKAGISGDQPACQGAASARMGRGAGSAVLRRARLFRIRRFWSCCAHLLWPSGALAAAQQKTARRFARAYSIRQAVARREAVRTAELAAACAMSDTDFRRVFCEGSAAEENT